MVVLDHAEVPLFTWLGQAGVTVFFTLSGFLITSLLLEEWARTGTVGLRRFWWRRSCRLLPAMLACVALVAVLGVALGSDRFAPLPRVAAALTYSLNWVNAFATPQGGLAHLWSLAIEEQLYLTRPIVVLLLARRGAGSLYAVVGAGALLALLLRVALWRDGEGHDRVTFGTDTRMDAVLIGCGLAVWMHHRPERATRASVVLVGASVVLASSLAPDAWSAVLGPTVVALAAATAIHGTANGQGVRLLANPALVGLGRRSYGLYLWHFPVTLLVTGFMRGSWLTGLAIILPVSAALTWLSWRYVEAPALRLKDRVPVPGHRTVAAP